MIAGNARRGAYSARMTWGVLLIVLAGLAVRALRLTWQPLWWDEGYSIYFATESLPRMLYLTAHDIHPPLYYALLHGWIGIWGGANPVVDRTLSVLLGVAALPLQAWLAWTLFPGRRRVLWLALFLLAASPMHLFYSQEVRMYGLAMLFSMWSSAALWRLVERMKTQSVRQVLGSWPALSYLIATVLGLYTLYYFALVLLAHLVWAAIYWRRTPLRFAAVTAVQAAAALIFSPWLIYAVPKLVGYVGSKVESDQDTPLGAVAYLARHLSAFTAGHISLPALPSTVVPLLIALVAVVLVAAGLTLGRASQPDRPIGAGGPTGALWTWLLVPLVTGWFINLRLPFFPEGGERLLLIILPYFVLLFAVGIDRTWSMGHLGKVALAALVVDAGLGIAAFYTVPRYAAHDYRPILREIVQDGRNEDTVLAIFPWQIGYWRAYTPRNAPELDGPRPELLSDAAVVWNREIESTIELALERGTVWFPEPLTFGSALPEEIEAYLESKAANLANRWYDATRLTAWAKLPAPPLEVAVADFGPIQLRAAGVAPVVATAENTPVAVTLVWEAHTSARLNVSLRLLDNSGQVWSSREYAAAWATTARAGAVVTETVGTIVPAGLPPGTYTVAVSLEQQNDNGSGQALTVAGSDVVEAPVGHVTVAAAEHVQAPVRLPIRIQLATPHTVRGLAILGFTGPDRTEPLLAGTELRVTLFLQSLTDTPADRTLYVTLQEPNGPGVAGYEGWPLSGYPVPVLSEGELLRVPVQFYVPGMLVTGDYQLVVGFQDPDGANKTPPVTLGTVSIRQRKGVFERPLPRQALPVPATVGTHVRLYGYEIEPHISGVANLRLYWEVVQPLLPPHHIFVHADAADGTTIAQQDGPPSTVDGIAPTGTWQPGEFLTTVHAIELPASTDFFLRVGLYDPATGVRLPVTIDGQPAGDSIELTMP